MSVDLTDPAISTSYEDIISHRSIDWLLLSYGEAREKLVLYACGGGGVDALKSNIPRTADNVFFGFCREDDGDKSFYACISYIPDNVSGVRRARALVHSRAVASLFKIHHTSLTFSKLEQLNTEHVRKQLLLGPTQIPRLQTNNKRSFVQRSASAPSGPPPKAPLKDHSAQPIRATASETTSGFDVVTSASAALRVLQLQEDEDDEPPPTPPKDKIYMMPSRRSDSRSRVAYLSDDGSGSGHSDDASTGAFSGDSHQASTRRRTMSPTFLTPEERARRRMELQKKKEAEERYALEQQALQQERLEREKEELRRLAEQEEAQRRVSMEKEKERALAERARIQKERRLQEELQALDFERKKREQAHRRLEQARLHEEQRRREEEQALERARKLEEERRLQEEQRREKRKQIQEFFAAEKQAEPVLLSGSVTIQSSSSISWRRRFFELSGEAMQFFKDARDRSKAIDTIVLTGGRVTAIKEPDEGYEELAAIPFSFAVEFSDDEAWCMFTDSAEEKDVLVSLLSQAATL